MPRPPRSSIARARLRAARDTAAAERAIYRAALDAINTWLTALRVELLRAARQSLPGLTASAYPQWPFIVDEAVQRSWNAWAADSNNPIIPQVQIAFGEAFQRLRAADDISAYRAELDYLAEVADRLKIWPEGAFEDIRPELLEALAEAESFDDIRDRVGRILNIDATTRDLRAQINEVETELAQDDLDPARRDELTARRRALWNAHDRSLGEWQWKARRIARTEAHGAVNAGALAKAKAVEEATGDRLYKRWLSTHDLRVRPTHAVADGQSVPLREKFRVGGFLLDHPADAIDVAPHEVINCRCTCLYYDHDQLQEELQGPAGSAGEIRPGGVRIGPDDPDVADDVVAQWAQDHQRRAPRLGQRGEHHGQQLTGEPAPTIDPDHQSEQPRVDLADVSDDDLTAWLEEHSFDDDPFFQDVMAEVDRRLDLDDPEYHDLQQELADHDRIVEWLDAEDQWRRDVEDWLDAEDDWREQYTRWLDEERNWRRHVTEWLDAEQQWETDPLPTLPHKDLSGYDPANPIDAQRDFDNDVTSVNPHFQDAVEWQINCQRVVQALELRRRGYDVHAGPNDGSTPGFNASLTRAQADAAGMDHYGRLWRRRDGSSPEFVKAVGKRSVLRSLASLPTGARGWLRVAWKMGGAHIFSWEVREERGVKVVRLIDGQPGLLDVVSYLDEAKGGSIYWMRVDDLMPVDDVRKMIEGG